MNYGRVSISSVTPFALLVLNAMGAVVYVVRASSGWRIAEEHGEIPVTGEPFIWAFAIFPVIAAFLVLNLVWATLILVRRQWRSERLWLLAAAVWLIAIGVDFAHH